MLATRKWALQGRLIDFEQAIDGPLTGDYIFLHDCKPGIRWRHPFYLRLTRTLFLGPFSTDVHGKQFETFLGGLERCSWRLTRLRKRKFVPCDGRRHAGQFGHQHSREKPVFRFVALDPDVILRYPPVSLGLDVRSIGSRKRGVWELLLTKRFVKNQLGDEHLVCLHPVHELANTGVRFDQIEMCISVPQKLGPWPTARLELAIELEPEL